MNVMKEKCDTGLHHIYDVRELIFQENDIGGFNRFDIIIHLLAIENYYEKNDYGFDLYHKLQAVLQPNIQETAMEQFLALIQSWEKSGYDNTSEIELDRNVHIFAGVPLIALALYHKNYDISCKVLQKESEASYGMDWLVENIFTTQDIYIIQNRTQLLFQEIQVPFVCVFWASASLFFDDILDRLNLIADVIECKDYTFEYRVYAQMVRCIYGVDDIDKWKIEEKIKHICHPKSDSLSMRKVLIRMSHPNYRCKRSNGNLLSKRGEEIKRIIRNSFKDKLDDYYYDNIIHMGDNFLQNCYVADVFESSQHIFGTV